MARKKFPPLLHQVTFTGIADKGQCVGRDAQGRVVFVDGAAPGDVADVVVFAKKKGILQGKIGQMLQPSPHRVEPFCQHYNVCGGCQWQHLAYEAQLEQKETIVRDAIRRIGKIEVGDFQPILGATPTSYYRNKLEYGCANRRWLSPEELTDDSISNLTNVIGFHRSGAYDKLIPIDHCHLQPEPSNTLRNGLQALAEAQGIPFFDMRERTGLLRQLMIRTSSMGQTMVVIAFFEDDQEKIRPFLDAALKAFPQITSLFYCINPKVNEYLMDLDMVSYHGPGYIEEALGHVHYRIGAKSFFQTNTAQAVRLFDVVMDFAGLKGTENVYDLYTGIGSIALYMAHKCKQVVGIEEIASAIDDARINAQVNGINNAVFYAGDVKNILTEEFALQHGKPDLLVTDPPRAGMHPQVVAMLRTLAAPRMVYVSCNPATQARDLQLLSEDYEVQKLRPVDMFPHTGHIESVALLVRKN